jgi:hypothetical protein
MQDVELSIVSLGVLGKDCSESELSPQPLPSYTVPRAQVAEKNCNLRFPKGQAAL